MRVQSINSYTMMPRFGNDNRREVEKISHRSTFKSEGAPEITNRHEMLIYGLNNKPGQYEIVYPVNGMNVQMLKKDEHPSITDISGPTETNQKFTYTIQVSGDNPDQAVKDWAKSCIHWSL